MSTLHVYGGDQNNPSKSFAKKHRESYFWSSMCVIQDQCLITPEVLVSLFLVHFNLVDSCRTVRSQLELMFEHVVKGSGWPREHRCKQFACAPYVTRSGQTQTGATLGSYKCQVLKGKHLLALGCFLGRSAVQSGICFTSWVCSVLCLVLLRTCQKQFCFYRSRTEVQKCILWLSIVLFIYGLGQSLMPLCRSAIQSRAVHRGTSQPEGTTHLVMEASSAIFRAVCFACSFLSDVFFFYLHEVFLKATFLLVRWIRCLVSSSQVIFFQRFL